MYSVVLSVIGADCPGVIHAASDELSRLECNIEAVTQTILQGQFAAIFIAVLREGLSPEEARAAVARRMVEAGLKMSVNVSPLDVSSKPPLPPSEPFVVTVSGPDKLNIIAAISRIFTEHGTNIENLKAILPDDGNCSCMLVFEVALPLTVDRSAFRRTLLAKGKAMGLDISIQHRDIFEALHRVSPL